MWKLQKPCRLSGLCRGCRGMCLWSSAGTLAGSSAVIYNLSLNGNSWLLPRLPRSQLGTAGENPGVREETEGVPHQRQTDSTLLETLGESDTEELGSVKTRFVHNSNREHNNKRGMELCIW